MINLVFILFVNMAKVAVAVSYHMNIVERIFLLPTAVFL